MALRCAYSETALYCATRSSLVKACYTGMELKLATERHSVRQGVIYELNGPDGSDTKKLLKVCCAASGKFLPQLFRDITLCLPSLPSGLPLIANLRGVLQVLKMKTVTSAIGAEVGRCCVLSEFLNVFRAKPKQD